MTQELKFLDEATGRVEGLAIPYYGPVGGKDLDGEFFDSQTDFAIDWFPEGRPLLYHHGIDEGVKSDLVGRQVRHRIDEAGVWAEAQLNMAHKYAGMIAELIAKKALGFSSGTILHLIKKESSGKITRWPWVELSITPTPANPYTMIDPSKTVSNLAALGLTMPEQLNTDNKPTPFEEHAETVVSAVKVFAERARDRAEFRAKEGRELSPANRGALIDLSGLLTEVKSGLDSFLEETDPEKGLQEYVRFQRDEARRLGVAV